MNGEEKRMRIARIKRERVLCLHGASVVISRLCTQSHKQAVQLSPYMYDIVANILSV